MMTHPPHWDIELKDIKSKAANMIATGMMPPDAILGIAVDDAVKRDYFIPRLEAILDDTRWAIIFRVINVEDGMRTTDVMGKK